jgi:NADH dehydrogenase/NADH:ubiquinone oxidoreductase subunit G
MVLEQSSRQHYSYGPSEGYELRCLRRLHDELGVDTAGAEAVLHLRRQVVELQSHIRQLEAELATQHASQSKRLARYRDVYFEATWIELEYEDEEE